MLSFFQEFGAAQRLASKKYNVIFFAESRYYFQYVQHLFEALVALPGIRIAYITADKSDEILSDERIDSYCLKTTLAGVFPRLQADAMIMTMPDLEHFIFKKSASVKSYIYVFHALVSTHQQYRLHAFNHYDAIFCTGPQQEEEVKESEGLYSLPAKELVRYGYPLLQYLKNKAEQVTVRENKVLIAPSWYDKGILSTCILPLAHELCKAGKEVWIRPHPEFVKRNKKTYAALLKQMQGDNNIRFDETPSVYTHLLDAAHLVTDRSGIALEYAFATKRPVLFIDTPLKIQNPDVSKFKNEPLENAYRNALGLSVGPDELHKVGNALQALESEGKAFKVSIQKAESETVFAPAHWLNGIQYVQAQLRIKEPT